MLTKVAKVAKDAKVAKVAKVHDLMRVSGPQFRGCVQ